MSTAAAKKYARVLEELARSYTTFTNEEQYALRMAALVLRLHPYDVALPQRCPIDGAGTVQGPNPDTPVVCPVKGCFYDDRALNAPYHLHLRRLDDAATAAGLSFVRVESKG